MKEHQKSSASLAQSTFAPTAMGAGSAPPGYGHEYAAEHYFDAWVALTEPENRDNETRSSLREHFSEME